MIPTPLAPTARTAGLVALLSLPVAAQSDVTDVIEHCSGAVVSVDVLFAKIDSPGRASQDGVNAVRVERPGSGVIVDAGGLVLTAAHLVEQVREDSDEYWVLVGLPGGGERRAVVVRRDEEADLALLRIQDAGSARYPALPLAPAREEPVGARVVALSDPAGSRPYAFAGALAFAAGPVRLREALLEPDQALLSDCRFHDLLDGGPLVNTRGQIVGLHNSSHLSPRPEGFGGEPEDGEEPEEDRDYAVIVSSEAVMASMGDLLEGASTLAPLPARPVELEPAVAAIERVAPSVVSVHHRAEGEHPAAADPTDPQSRRLPEGLGSGVVVDPSGLVLTTSLLFGDDEGGTTTVRLADGRLIPAQLLARKPATQVALLRLELGEGETLPAARPVGSGTLAQGEVAAVVARPYAPAVHMSVGVLSALEREGLVQLASWVHPGHRGGAVVDREGRLVGIAVREPASFGRADQDSYLGFAAPISTALAALEEAWTAAGATNPLVDATEAELAARRTPVAGVAERTRSSLINVLVSKAVEKPSTGFDPFAGSGEEEFQLLGQGSGVIIEASGLALSNWHVVDAALADDGTQSESSKVEVTLPDGRRFEARVLSTSRDDDLALLALQIGPDDELVPVELGDSDELRPGQPVVAIGNPLGLANSVSAGIVSTTGLDTRIQGRLREYKGMVMTDAAINPGNSGGALLDLDGRLVGINSAGRVGAGMAIPVNKARDVFSDKLLSAKSLKAAYLGLEVADRGGELVIDSLDGEGPAARAGAALDDRVLSLAGRETPGKTAFARVALDLEATAPCALVVERDGERLELQVLPVSFAAWTIARSSGIEVVEVDYAAEAELVRAASIDLYRAYTQREDGEPPRLMAGALRVTRVGSLLGKERPAVEPGDLLLGITSITMGTAAVHERLVRFESLADLSEAIAPLATKEGGGHLFWLWRDGEVVSTEVFVRRPPR
jgi:S1-C subfamily serine protease